MSRSGLIILAIFFTSQSILKKGRLLRGGRSQGRSRKKKTTKNEDEQTLEPGLVFGREFASTCPCVRLRQQLAGTILTHWSLGGPGFQALRSTAFVLLPFLKALRKPHCSSDHHDSACNASSLPRFFFASAGGDCNACLFHGWQSVPYKSGSYFDDIHTVYFDTARF